MARVQAGDELLTVEEQVRLFIGIEVPDELKAHFKRVRDRLVQLTFGHLYAVTWVADRNLHMTLKFLGEVDPSQAGPLKDRLSQVAVEPARLYADRVVCFPPRGKVRVIGVGLAGDTDVLNRLHDQIEVACEALGLPRENRPYTPHVTLGRNKPGRYDSVARFVREKPPTDCWPGPAFTASSFALIQSELRPDGPVYTPLARFGG